MKDCRYCRYPFSPKFPDQQYCTQAHARMHLAERRRGRPATEGQKLAKSVRAVADLFRRLGDQFGPITERDYRIAAVVGKDAYQRGYAAAYATQAKQGKRRAA